MKKSKPERDFDDAITRAAADAVHKRNSTYIAEENVLQYRHGSQWSHVDANDGKENTGTFVSHSAEFSMGVERLIERDTSTLQRFIHTMSEELHGQFVGSLFQMISEETEKIGNSVQIGPKLPDEDADQAMQDGFLEMFRKVELGISRYGTVTYPTLFVHPDNKRVLDLIEQPVPEQHQRELDSAHYAAEISAISREAGRLSRYKR
ncbi:hypothetical protein [Devosia yakushimensis]|nr:hypothetical protein [Devosia yakushimensis]